MEKDASQKSLQNMRW